MHKQKLRKKSLLTLISVIGVIMTFGGQLKAKEVKDPTQLEKDSLLMEWNKKVDEIFNRHHDVKHDTSGLFSGAVSDSVIKASLDDSLLKLRFDSLNAQSPISLQYNENIKEYIKLYLLDKKEATSRILTRKDYYFHIYEKMLDKYNLPLELKYISIIESALKTEARSWAGASGLWQFMVQTARLYNMDVGATVDERYDLYKATEAACHHFRDLYKKYGDWLLVIAAYNAGTGNVNRAIRRAGGVIDFWEIRKYLPKETRNYVPFFIAVNYVFNYADEHLIKPGLAEIPFLNTDTVSVNQKLKLKQVSEYLNIDHEMLKNMNPAYRKGIIPDSDERTYNLYLPADKIDEFLSQEDSIYNYKTVAEKRKEKKLREKYGEVTRGNHTVRNGESLGSIADRYGCEIADLKQWNNLNSNMIHPGEKLTIYAPKKVLMGKATPQSKKKQFYTEVSREEYIYHKVRKGDTLSEIAEKYPRTSVRTLKRLNNISNVRRLKPGQKIKISKSSG